MAINPSWMRRSVQTRQVGLGVFNVGFGLGDGGEVVGVVEVLQDIAFLNDAAFPPPLARDHS